jgi:hypothetical protein
MLVLHLCGGGGDGGGGGSGDLQIGRTFLAMVLLKEIGWQDIHGQEQAAGVVCAAQLLLVSIMIAPGPPAAGSGHAAWRQVPRSPRSWRPHSAAASAAAAAASGR